MPNTRLQWLILFSVLLTLVVITLGAYVRLSDAGLGCPDWPGCYGKAVVPATDAHIKAANKAYPDRPVEQAKAWKEMVHRYLAGVLGLFVVAIAIIARRESRARSLPLCIFLVVLVTFQAALGMWTVTLKLNPLIVTAHLLMGFLTFVLLAVLYFRERFGSDKAKGVKSKQPLLPKLALLTLVMLVVQIFLGGWTSSNYAAVICPDFPTCQDKRWLPAQDFKEAFVLWRGFNQNYEGGVLKADARISIQMTHRLGAVISALLLILTIIFVLFRGKKPARIMASILFILLSVQVTLGATVVLMSRPLHLAVAHNGVAALLLLLTSILYLQLRRET